MMATSLHTPVALERTCDLLSPSLGGPDPLAVDMTLGLGGHTEALLRAHPGLHVIGIDRDPEALSHARQRLAEFGSRVSFVHARYDQLSEVLADQQPQRCVNAVVLDAGVSSMQLDEPSRGFSYLHDAPLDMRMNPMDPVDAADLINTLSQSELQRLFQRYGDEPLAARYARAIVQERTRGPVETTGSLVSIIDQATPGGHPRRGHNAKRVFQALRIAVNHELDSLESGLVQALDCLCVGGRIVVLSYQSGEDRLAKHLIDARTRADVPVDVPVVPEAHQPTFTWVVKGPEGPGDQEAAINPRSASLRLRAAERIRQESH